MKSNNLACQRLLKLTLLATLGLCANFPLFAQSTQPKEQATSQPNAGGSEHASGHGTSRLSDKPIGMQIQDVPQRNNGPLIQLGQKYFQRGRLKIGIHLPTGAVWNPSLQVFGTYRTALQVFDNGVNAARSEWSNRLDLHTNLSLTPTERILFSMRPFDNNRRFTGYYFEPDNGDGWQERLDVQTESLFFEGDFGELFPNLDISDSSIFDFGFAVGRQPIRVQDGLLVEDSLDSIGIVRNTLKPKHFANLRMTFLYAWDDIHRDTHIEAESADMIAFMSEADLGISTLAFDAIYVEAKESSGDGFFFGASAVQRIGEINTTYRAVLSLPVDGETADVKGGFLQLVELSMTPHGTHDILYLNAALGMDEFSSAARAPDAGGPLGRVGLLFQAVGLGRFGSALSNDADDFFALALGYQKFFNDTRSQIIVEAGTRVDFSSSNASAAALGVRYQHALGNRFILQPFVFGALQEGIDDAIGARLELQVKF